MYERQHACVNELEKYRPARRVVFDLTEAWAEGSRRVVHSLGIIGFQAFSKGRSSSRCHRRQSFGWRGIWSYICCLRRRRRHNIISVFCILTRVKHGIKLIIPTCTSVSFDTVSRYPTFILSFETITNRPPVRPATR